MHCRSSYQFAVSYTVVNKKVFSLLLLRSVNPRSGKWGRTMGSDKSFPVSTVNLLIGTRNDPGMPALTTDKMLYNYRKRPIRNFSEFPFSLQGTVSNKIQKSIHIVNLGTNVAGSIYTPTITY